MRHLVYLINKANENSLHFEWELILLSTFSKIGKIEYEKEWDGKYPDIRLYLEDEFQDLAIDITTVSDKGLHFESLVASVQKKLREEVGKRKLDFNQFSLDFGKFIKESARSDDYITEDLNIFLDKLSHNPELPDNFENNKAGFRLIYKPQGNRIHTSPITSHKRSTNNPFYNALEKKRDQLKHLKAFRGIVLCDGNSEMFFFKQTGLLNFGSDDVIRQFLQKNLDIDFVLTVWVDRIPTETTTEKFYRVRTELFENANFKKLPEKIKTFLRNVEDYLPRAFIPVPVAVECIRDNTISLYVKKVIF